MNESFPLNLWEVVQNVAQKKKKKVFIWGFCYHDLRYFDLGGLGGGEGKLICVLVFSQSPQTLVIPVSF